MRSLPAPPDDDNTTTGRFSPPSLTINVALESTPVVTVDTATEGQHQRLAAWIKSNPHLRQLVGLAVLLSDNWASAIDWSEVEELDL